MIKTQLCKKLAITKGNLEGTLQKRKVIVLLKQKRWNRQRPIKIPQIASHSPIKSSEHMVYLIKGNVDISKIWQTMSYHPNLKRPETVLDQRPCVDEKGVLNFKAIRAIYSAETGILRPTMAKMTDLKLVVTGIHRDSLSEYRGKRHVNLACPKTSVWGLEAFVFQPPNRTRPDEEFVGLPNNDFSGLKTWAEVILSYDSMRGQGVMMLKGQDLPFTMDQYFLYETNAAARKNGENRSFTFDLMDQQDVFSSKTVYLVRDLSQHDLMSARNVPISIRLPKKPQRRTHKP